MCVLKTSPAVVVIILLQSHNFPTFLFTILKKYSHSFIMGDPVFEIEKQACKLHFNTRTENTFMIHYINTYLHKYDDASTFETCLIFFKVWHIGNRQLYKRYITNASWPFRRFLNTHDNAITCSYLNLVNFCIPIYQDHSGP